MQHIFFKATLLLFFASIFVSCDKEKDKSKDTSITTCIITVNEKDYEIKFDPATKKFVLTLPEGTPVPSEATLKDLALAAGASSSVLKGAKITISNNTATIVITAEDGTKATFTIEFTTKYIVSFNSNGGTEIAIQNITLGGKATRPENPKRDGYTFVDWYKDETFTNAFNFDNEVINANTTLHAKWNIIVLVVSFNTNKGTAVAAQNINWGGKVARPKENPKREGAVFMGWFKDAAFKDTFPFDKEIIKANTTIHAKWGFVVSYFPKNGSDPLSKVVGIGEKIPQPTPPPTKAECTFKGWYTNDDLSGSAVDPNQITVSNADINLYAKWELSMVITSYSGDAFLGVAMRDATILADGDTVLSITNAGANLEYTWTFGGLTGTKTSSAEGTFLITKLDVKTATLTDGAKFTFTLSGTSKEATYKANEIRHWKDLQAMRVNLAGEYSLMKDISFPTVGTGGLPTEGFEPIGTSADKFTGKFHGNLHTISNFKINRPTTNYVGLFGYTDGATIQKVIIDHVGIQGQQNVGTVVGRADNSSMITNVGMKSSNSLAVSGIGQNVGGIVGYVDNSKVIGYATGAVSGNSFVGGLVGYADNNSTVSGYATGAVTNSFSTGGLVGYMDNSSTVSGYATGAVIASGNYSGGLVGIANKLNKVSGYATGAVSGTNNVGGLVGYVQSGTVSGYARGTVTKSSGTNTTFGLLVGNGTATGYNSAGESSFGGGATSQGANNDGIAVTISTATKSSFSLFSFDDATPAGPWHWVGDGKWPAINLGFDADFSAIAPGDLPEEQPL